MNSLFHREQLQESLHIKRTKGIGAEDQAACEAAASQSEGVGDND